MATRGILAGKSCASGVLPAAKCLLRASLIFRLELWREARLLLRERVCGEGIPPGLRGYAAFMTLIASGANSEALGLARNICAGRGQTLSAPTLIGDLADLPRSRERLRPADETRSAAVD